MGEDFSGNIYSGALDNASGMSFVIEMSKYIKSLGTPDRDIIFVGFNAEEYGFKGSSAFAKTYYSKIKSGKVFNFDMIGGNTAVPLSIMGAKKDNTNTPLVHEVSNICSESHIKYNLIFQDASDHSPFRQLGINSVTFCDDDTTRIHTPNDKAQFINTSSIETCYTAASKEILTSAFSKNPIVLYDKFLLVSSGIGTAAAGVYLVSITLIHKKKHL
jgi:Zn-dependent M28 family amino/carboxypeptidase